MELTALFLGARGFLLIKYSTPRTSGKHSDCGSDCLKAF